jgi:broad specificity phosphatase PhoE
MPAIYLIRHGQASFGLGDYDQLSETGMQQAALLGTHLASKSLKVAQAVAGAMRRHQQTADGCLRAVSYPGALRIDPRWNEFDHQQVLKAYQPQYADMGAIAKELMKQPNPKAAFQSIFSRAVERWISGKYDSDYTETWSHFNERVADVLTETLQNAEKGGATLVFTSGGVISAAAYKVLGVPAEQSVQLQYRMPNCSITKIASGSSGTHLITLNEYGFLEAHDRMLTFR